MLEVTQEVEKWLVLKLVELFLPTGVKVLLLGITEEPEPEPEPNCRVCA